MSATQKCGWCNRPAVARCDAEIPGRLGNGPMMATCGDPPSRWDYILVPAEGR
jgi:hypothetical protein